jgi:predicted enzyme related to lactoylglutathione lyase
MEPMEVPEKGWMAIVTDPTGAPVGLWQPTGHQGIEVVGEAGAPVWHQLTTRDYGAALDFYRQVFGWQTEVEADTPEFRYSTASFDGEPLLGVMDGSVLADGVPSTWIFFLGAEDVDKAVELITANGGTVLRAAEDTPYGRLAAVADPTGAAFNLSSLTS